MDRLLASGRTELLETGGYRPIAPVSRDVVRTLDVKCPGSGEANRQPWPDLDELTPRDEVKFMIADRADYEYAHNVVRRQDLAAHCGAVLFSPHGELDVSPISGDFTT